MKQIASACHGGGSNLSPALPDVFAEFKKIGHPFPSGTNLHDAAENPVLNNNRHATCADCHNCTRIAAGDVVQCSAAHSDLADRCGGRLRPMARRLLIRRQPVRELPALSRLQRGESGQPDLWIPAGAVSRDPLNVIPQMNSDAKSSHPVMHTRSSGLPQPSLLDTMLDFSGGTTKGRAMGAQIFCTDCHNADDNREFGRAGPNGPHGSKWWHILERDYEDSQAPGGPGTLITINLNPQPDLTVNGPYGMCAKCHNLRR